MPDCSFITAKTAADVAPKHYSRTRTVIGWSNSATRMIPLQEYRYNEAARRCGIEVTDFKLVNGKYFATKRFDITDEGERIHTATAGGLLCLSLSNPVLDYDNLLALTGYITQNPYYVEQMYRRMVFNYLTDNKDDHCKNFSFVVRRDASGSFAWYLAPAYGLTLCEIGRASCRERVYVLV